MKSSYALQKTNLYLMAIGFMIIILGFALMIGPGSTETHFEPDIFSFRRIKLAPAVCFSGFVFVIIAIMYKTKSKNEK